MLKTGIDGVAAYGKSLASGGASMGPASARGTVHTKSLESHMPPVEAFITTVHGPPNRALNH